MEAELVALATAGATALIQQMAADTWTSVRDRAVSFFSRGSTTPDRVAAELDTARAELAEAQRSADEEAAADIQPEWRSRMRRTLRADLEAAAELRALLDELSPEETAPRRLDVHNTISGGTQHGPVIRSGTIGNIHFGSQAAEPGERWPTGRGTARCEVGFQGRQAQKRRP